MCVEEMGKVGGSSFAIASSAKQESAFMLRMVKSYI